MAIESLGLWMPPIWNEEREFGTEGAAQGEKRKGMASTAVWSKLQR